MTITRPALVRLRNPCQLRRDEHHCQNTPLKMGQSDPSTANWINSLTCRSASGPRADSQPRLEEHVISGPDLRDNLGARFRMITDDNLIDIALEQQLLTKICAGGRGCCTALFRSAPIRAMAGSAAIFGVSAPPAIGHA